MSGKAGSGKEPGGRPFGGLDPKAEEKVQEAAAFSVHLLTASGAFFAVMAALAAIRGDWIFFWLWMGLALLIDGIDGPIARKLHVGERLPNWSGAMLDNVIDYVTYVFLPALAVPLSGILTGGSGVFAAGVIAVTGALYYADTRMKTADYSFRGFPIVWNVIVYLLAVTNPTEAVAMAIVVSLGILTFVPVNFVHPVRVKRMRPLTLAVTAVWAIAAALALWQGLKPEAWVLWPLIAASVYLGLIGYVLQVTDPENPPKW